MKLITEKDETIKAIKRILESQSLISIDEEDFGDYGKIIGYHSFGLIDRSSEFHYSIDEDSAVKTNKIIVNTACNDGLTLAVLEPIFSNIRMFFNADIEVIYGHSEGFLNQYITIDIFLIEQ